MNNLQEIFDVFKEKNCFVGRCNHNSRGFANDCADYASGIVDLAAVAAYVTAQSV